MRSDGSLPHNGAARILLLLQLYEYESLYDKPVRSTILQPKRFMDHAPLQGASLLLVSPGSCRDGR